MVDYCQAFTVAPTKLFCHYFSVVLMGVLYNGRNFIIVENSCESKNHKTQLMIVSSSIIVDEPVCSCVLRGIVHSSQHTIHSWTFPFLVQTPGSH